MNYNFVFQYGIKHKDLKKKTYINNSMYLFLLKNDSFF